jgi:alpha-tubulin suppressor-like RCC1 family protein/phosphodiesterase/alkaline phosphatase D-like protein
MRTASRGKLMSRVLRGLIAAVAMVLLAWSPASAAASSGQLYSFGSNLYGQLGDESNLESTLANPNPSLVTLPGASGPVSRLAAGEGHSLAVTSAGQLYAFGNNAFGELGVTTNSGTQNANATPLQVTLPGATGPVVEVATGANHSLAVTSSGQLYAFGLNRFGQLGSTTRNGTEKPNPTPALVTLPGATGPVVRVAAGVQHSLAVTSTGQLYSFGENNLGQLGVATNQETAKSNPTPTLVTLPGATGGVVQVAAGSNFSLAVTSTGQLYAFGSNNRGQLGNSTNVGEALAANSTPTLVSLPGATGGVAEVAAGAEHSLALTSTGQLYAFGSNRYGQLGNSTNAGKEAANSTPVLVTLPGISGSPSGIAAGDADSVVVSSSGQLYGFGENMYGQTGNPLTAESTAPNPTPVLVTLPAGARAISAGHGAVALHTLALVIPAGGAAPAVQTNPAGSVGRYSAVANAAINPDGGNVSACAVEYGTTTSYGASVPCNTLPGSGESPVAVSATLSGLQPNTTYHFRARATNPGGTSYGADASFTTEVQPPPTETTSAPSGLKQNGATLNGSVNPNGAEVTECRVEYGTSKLYGLSVPCSTEPGAGEAPVPVSAEVTGLVTHTTYHYRFVATNLGGTSHSADATFSTTPPPPTVTTGAASALTPNSATVSGTVNPNEGAVTECRFEYGASPSMGSSAPCKPNPGNGAEAVEVTADISGLSANTYYYFRIVAVNAGGSSSGAIASLKTEPLPPPTVTTGSASSVGKRSATFNGTVNPNGVAVEECTFEYGTTTSYGSSVACGSLPGEGNKAVSVSAPVSGLQPGTTYYFRLVAGSAGGSSVGAVQSLTTHALQAPTVITGAASSVTKHTATLTGTVDPHGEAVEGCTFEYGTTTEYGSSIPCSSLPGEVNGAVGVSASVAGLQAETTYYFRLVASSPGGSSTGQAQSLTTPAIPPPTATTGSAASVTKNSATLTGTVNPNGEPVTTCVFEYGTTTSYGESVPCASLPAEGKSAVAVTASLTGLAPATTYYFRLVATGPGGSSEGANQSLTTSALRLPAVNTEAATSIGKHRAVLNASVNPSGLPITECFFEYGTTSMYGSTAPCSSLPPADENPVAVSASLEGLSEGTIYHYRIVAANSEGTRYGLEHEFGTLGPPEFGRCVKVPGQLEGKKTVYHGAFKSAGCALRAEAKNGKYEWYEGPLHDHFTIGVKGKGASRFETAAGAQVNCTTESGSGEYSGTNAVQNVTIVFGGCQTSARHKATPRPCSTPGASAGELRTQVLEGALGWQKRSESKVVLELFPVGGPGTILQFVCGTGSTTTVGGSLVVPMKVGKMLQMAPLKFKEHKGVQQPETLEGGVKPLLQMGTESGGEQIGLNSSSTLVSEEPLAVNAVA